MRELDLIFGDEKTQVIKDLKNGVDSENVLLLLSNKLSKFQPTTMFQMPQGYLDSPKGRMVYALRSDQLKQMNVILDEVERGIRNAKTKADYVKAFGRGAELIAIMAAAQLTANEIKDFVFRRKTTLSEKAADALLNIVFISRYMMWQIREDGIKSALLNMASPNVSWAEYIGRDAMTIYEAASDPEKRKDFAIKNLESWRMTPIAGQEFYWWFGGGREKQIRKEERRIGGEYSKAKKYIEEKKPYLKSVSENKRKTIEDYNARAKRAEEKGMKGIAAMWKKKALKEEETFARRYGEK
jgi:hypothetical protein